MSENALRAGLKFRRMLHALPHSRTLFVVCNVSIALALAVACASILLAKMRPPLQQELEKRSLALCLSTALEIGYSATVADAKGATRELEKLASEQSARVQGAWVLADGASLAGYGREGVPPPAPEVVRQTLAKPGPRVLWPDRGSLLEVVCPIAALGSRAESAIPVAALRLLVATDEIQTTVRRSFAGAVLPLLAVIFAAVGLLLWLSIFIIGRLRLSMQQLRDAQGQLVAYSRKAGMADIASTVLHNVGNVLNSVNVSAGVVGDAIRSSKIAGLTRANDLIRSHASDLGAFFGQDEKGKRLPAYLEALASAVEEEHSVAVRELQFLQKNIDHIKVIVALQQSNAGETGGLLERLSLSELLDDALCFNELSFEQHKVRVVRDFDDLGMILADRHKVFQIVMNLLTNARHAVKDVERDRQITVRVRKRDQARVAIAVEDTGCGIEPQNLARVFNLGFTTKKDGHGFGLHSSACSAAEMGGTLTCQSAGPGAGAAFTLELPM